MFPATDFRLKRLKKSLLPFQHHKAILQPDHNTSPKSSNTSTTTKPPPLNSEIVPTQSTSTNTPSIITVATTTANTATTTTTRTVSTSYTNTIQHQLNIPILSKIRTPSTSSGWDMGGGGGGCSPTIRTTTKGGHHHLAFLKTPRTQGTHEDAHSTHTKKIVFRNSNNKGNTHKKL